MIDWISARVPLEWDRPINEGQLVHVRSDGSVEFSIDKRKLVLGSFDSTFSIRSVELGFCEISGNPAKFLQGHNLFGTDDLRALLFACMLKICQALAITPRDRELEMWRRGEIALTRVDVTQMYELDTRADVRQWLQAASTCAHVRWRGRGHYQEGTLTYGKVAKGKRAATWQMVLYCKGDEVELPRSRFHSELPFREELLKWADNKLRIELRLRTGELKKVGLRFASHWTEQRAFDVFTLYLARIELAEEHVVEIDMIDEMKPRHRAIYALWQSGADLREVYPRPTFYRYRAELRDLLGVDIATRHAADNVIPLRRVLEARPAGVPSWGSAVMFNPRDLIKAA